MNQFRTLTSFLLVALFGLLVITGCAQGDSGGGAEAPAEDPAAAEAEAAAPQRKQ